MAQPLREFTRFIWWMQTKRQVAANRLRPSQPTWTVSPPERNGSYRPHPPSPFIITQSESWYSFYRPTEGGRLSRPRHCSKDVQPEPKAVYRSGCCDKHNCPRWDSNLGPLTPQSGMLPLGHYDTADVELNSKHWPKVLRPHSSVIDCWTSEARGVVPCTAALQR